MTRTTLVTIRKGRKLLLVSNSYNRPQRRKSEDKGQFVLGDCASLVENGQLDTTKQRLQRSSSETRGDHVHGAEEDARRRGDPLLCLHHCRTVRMAGSVQVSTSLKDLLAKVIEMWPVRFMGPPSQ
jgi:hypothetical protein